MKKVMIQKRFKLGEKRFLFFGDYKRYSEWYDYCVGYIKEEKGDRCLILLKGFNALFDQMVWLSKKVNVKMGTVKDINYYK